MSNVASGNTVNLDKLAYAISMAETMGCTRGYGAMYNNCFGIKNGNTAPCTKVGKSNMCIYEKTEDSFVAFKLIWTTWYKTYPTETMAAYWTGNDRPQDWLKNVEHYYNL